MCLGRWQQYAVCWPANFVLSHSAVCRWRQNALPFWYLAWLWALKLELLDQSCLPNSHPGCVFSGASMISCWLALTCYFLTYWRLQCMEYICGDTQTESTLALSIVIPAQDMSKTLQRHGYLIAEGEILCLPSRPFVDMMRYMLVGRQCDSLWAKPNSIHDFVPSCDPENGSKFVLIVPENSTGSCGIMVNFDLKSSTPILKISIPSIIIEPEEGSKNRKNANARVDFPAPNLLILK